MGRFIKAILLSLVAVLLASMPVLAAVSYRAAYTIVESNGTAYDMLAVSELADNQWMADNGFMQDDALDTRIETLGGVAKPHLVVDDRTLAATAILASSQTNLYFTTANSDLSSMDIIPGYDGFITIDDTGDVAPQLEMGNDFEVEMSGYVDTDAGADKNLVYKLNAFRTYISGATDITSTLADTATTETLAPDGVGNETAIPNLFGAATHWQANLTNDGNTSYVQQVAAPWARDLFTTTDTAIGAGWIIDVTVYMVTSEFGADGGLGKTSIRTNGTTYDGAETALTVAYTTDSTTYITNPQTGNSWTWAEVDAMEIGVSLSDANQSRCTQVYAVVNYSPTTSVTATGIDSGEHIIKTVLHNNIFSIQIDEEVPVTTAAVGVTVLDNDNDWIINQNNVMPWMDYFFIWN